MDRKKFEKKKEREREVRRKKLARQKRELDVNNAYGKFAEAEKRVNDLYCDSYLDAKLRDNVIRAQIAQNEQMLQGLNQENDNI